MSRNQNSQSESTTTGRKQPELAPEVELNLASNQTDFDKETTVPQDSYIDMGIRNPGYDSEQSKIQGRPIPPRENILSPYAIDTPVTTGMYIVNHSDGKISKETCLTDNTYLTPVNPSNFDKNPEYEDLANYAAVIEHSRSGNNSGILPRKKKNLIYESTRPADQYVPSDHKVRPKTKCKEDSISCLKIIIIPVALIATLALVLTILQLTEILKIKTCAECGSTVGDPSSALSRQQASSNKFPQNMSQRILDLESNLTLLMAKIEPQATEIQKLTNTTLHQQNTIAALKSRLQIEEQNNKNVSGSITALENRLQIEEQDNKKLNGSVLKLNTLIQTLSGRVASINTTLSNSMVNLQRTLDSQRLSLSHLSETVDANITAVMVLLSNETSERKYYDTVLQSRIDNLKSEQNNKIANITKEVSSVQISAKSDTRQLESMLNSSVNNQMQQRISGDSALKNDIAAINSTLLQKILNISLTPGSQGPQGLQGVAGAGNLSACIHVETPTSTTLTANPSAATASIGHAVKPNKVIVGATCSSNKAYFKQLHVNSQQLTCECTDAKGNSGESMNCIIHVWECPKIS